MDGVNEGKRNICMCLSALFSTLRSLTRVLKTQRVKATDIVDYKISHWASVTVVDFSKNVLRFCMQSH